MALTWAKRKNGRLRKPDPFSRVDALAARRVLRYAYRARSEFAKAVQSSSIADQRLRWVTAVTLLRTVGYALRSNDTSRSPEMKSAVRAAWDRWKQQPFAHLVFHEFIEKERNMLLKEYRFAIMETHRRHESETAENGPLSLLIGDKSYSAIEAIDTAIAWWEAELERIEIESESARLPQTRKRRGLRVAGAEP